jgi:hypothetical protein
MRRYIISAAVVLALVVSVSVSTAQAAGIVYGRVEWTDSTTIIFKEYGGAVHRLPVELNAPVTLNGRPVRLVDLKAGTPVTVYYENGPVAPVAIGIAATARFGPPGGG